MTRIGASDLDVFPLNLGGNVFGWTADKDQSFAVLDAYLDAGGDFVDTADGYSAWVPGNTGGDSELIIGEWMSRRGVRDRMVVTTKVSQHPDFRGLAYQNVIDAADASLARLGTDHLDLYYAHFDDESTPLEETVDAFAALVTAGKVRYVGVSNYSADRIDQWVAIAKDRGYAAPVALQPHYSLVTREPFESELAERAERHGLGVMPYYSLASGFLTGKYRSMDDFGDAPRAAGARGFASQQGFDTVDALVDIAAAHGVEPATIALAWLLSRDTVVAPIASARTPEQLTALVAAVGLELDAEQLARLDAVSAPDGERTLS